MKKKMPFLVFFLFISLLLSCNEQASSEKKLYNEDFKWSISLPADFSLVAPEDWQKMQNEGADAIEETHGGEVINLSNTIFVFKNGEANYFDANWQPFDPAVDGDYKESWKTVNDLLYETFSSQMPAATIDSSSTTQDISGLEFKHFSMEIKFPQGTTMHSHMYNRLFGQKELTINIIYIDEEQGKRMMNSWLHSTFE